MSEYKAFDPMETFNAITQTGRSQEWLKAAAEQFWLNQDHLLDCAQSRLMADASELQQLVSAATISMFEPISSPRVQTKPAAKMASIGNAA